MIQNQANLHRIKQEDFGFDDILVEHRQIEKELDDFLFDQEDLDYIKEHKKQAVTFKESLKLAQKLKELQSTYATSTFEDIINYSNKIKVLFQMLDEFKRKGNKVLIFSKTKIFLDLLEKLVSCLVT